MRIKNINGLSAGDLQQEVNRGGRFVYYLYTVSLIFITFKRTSGVYLIRQKESAATKGWMFTFLSSVFGWWGFPYGPLYTIKSVRTNLRGGKDVTDEIMATVTGFILFEETQKEIKVNKK